MSGQGFGKRIAFVLIAAGSLKTEEFRMKRIASRCGVVAALALGALLSSGSAFAQQTIKVGWTIPAEEAKYWMMKRPQEFADLGKKYNIEWVQFQGTAPMTQALAAGALDCATQSVLALAQGVQSGNLKANIVAQHVFEKPGSFSVYWAVKDNSPIKTIADLKGKTMSINTLGSGIYGPMAILLKQAGLDPAKDVKLVEVGFALSEEALRSGRVDFRRDEPAVRRAHGSQGRYPQAVFVVTAAGRYRSHSGSLSCRFHREAA